MAERPRDAYHALQWWRRRGCCFVYVLSSVFSFLSTEQIFLPLIHKNFALTKNLRYVYFVFEEDFPLHCNNKCLFVQKEKKMIKCILYFCWFSQKIILCVSNFFLFNCYLRVVESETEILDGFCLPRKLV